MSRKQSKLRSWVVDETWNTGILKYQFRCSICYCAGPEAAHLHTSTFVKYLAENHLDNRTYHIEDEYFLFRQDREGMFVCDFRVFITVNVRQALPDEFVHLTKKQNFNFNGLSEVKFWGKHLKRMTTGDEVYQVSGWQVVA